jgi:malate dehydrogenase (oxaloacetate-decarboxylating)(NADP+)
LASLVTQEDLAVGRVYPPLERIRDVSAYIAAAVMRVAVEQQVAPGPVVENPVEVARAAMYQPRYRSYVV